MLGFKGDEEIKKIAIENNDFHPAFYSENKKFSGIKNSVDILCTNEGKHKIAIEMQRYNQSYFFAREQEYMSKIISHQVKVGESKEYDKKILKTYIIVIARNDVFVEESSSKNSKLWEMDVVPTIEQTKKMYPGNKMYWKFFELSKYKKYANDKEKKELKGEWLSFLNDCGTAKSIPDNVSEIIKKGYEIMKLKNLTPDQKVLLWKHKRDMEYQELFMKEQMKLIEEKSIEKGVIKTTIETVKNLLAKKIMDLKQIKEVFKNFDSKVVEYVATHLDDANETIYKDIIGQSSESINQNDTGEI